MRSVYGLIYVTTSLIFSTLAVTAHADGLSDLKKNLAKYSNASPVKGTLDVKNWEKSGDKDEDNGSGSAFVEAGAKGLQVQVSKDFLDKIESEEAQKEKNNKAKTPYSNAMKEISIPAVRPMLFAADVLQKDIEKHIFKSERNDTLAGKNVRVLNFEISQDKLSEKDKKYLKDYSGNYDIWIAEDGTPLQVKKKIVAKGRFALVVSFEMSSEEEMNFATVSDRLVMLKRVTRNSGSGAGEKNENKSTRTLILQ